MMFLYFLIFITTTAVACPVERDFLLSCLEHFLDPTHLGMVTVSSIDNFLKAQRQLGPNACIPRSILDHISGIMLVRDCDTDRDGVLNIKDWTQPNSCLTKQNHQHYVCTLCERCGFSFLIK